MQNKGNEVEEWLSYTPNDEEVFDIEIVDNVTINENS